MPAANVETRDRAWRSPRAWAILLIIFLIGITADLGSKSWSFANVADRAIVLDRSELLARPDFDPIGWHPIYHVGPAGIIDFKLVLNPGAVFGIGAHQRWFFIGFTLVALTAGLIVFSLFTRRQHWLAHAAIGLVLAGGVGNLYDRLVFGRVRDFIHMLPGRYLPNDWTWPGTNNPELFPWVFNIADVELLVGMLILLTVLNRKKKAAVPASPAPSPAG